MYAHIHKFRMAVWMIFGVCVGVSAHTYTRVSSEVKFMVPIKCISCFLNFYLHFYAFHNNDKNPQAAGGTAGQSCRSCPAIRAGR